MYTIVKKTTGEYVVGTETSNDGKKVRQILSAWRILIYKTVGDAYADFRDRKCSNDYKIVRISSLVVKDLLPNEKHELAEFMKEN